MRDILMVPNKDAKLLIQMLKHLDKKYAEHILHNTDVNDYLKLKNELAYIMYEALLTDQQKKDGQCVVIEREKDGHRVRLYQTYIA